MFGILGSEHHVRGPDQSLHEATIDQAVRDTAERFPGREAVISRHQNRRLTWRELREHGRLVIPSPRVMARAFSASRLIGARP